MTLAEIKDKKLSCVIHTKSKNEAKLLEGYMPWEGYWGDNPSDRWCVYSEQTAYYIKDGILMQFSPTSFYKDRYPTYGEVYEFSDLFATGGTVSIHDLPIESLYRPMNIEIQPLELVCNEEQAKNIAERLAKELNGMLAFHLQKREEKKMPTKFTFYVTEGYRIDKSNNTKIPTMTTEVLVNGKDYQYSGSATCDKTDYEEREGVLNAIANAVCGGNFDREFNKVMKNKAFADKKSRTCTYCGQVFDTVEEKQEHEAWHVECKKARRERYLLRKRAKEIAFEEQAQKMAKEMIEK